jgi:hypothetical protein
LRIVYFCLRVQPIASPFSSNLTVKFKVEGVNHL